jgi:hypothetical protein
MVDESFFNLVQYNRLLTDKTNEILRNYMIKNVENFSF